MRNTERNMRNRVAHETRAEVTRNVSRNLVTRGVYILFERDLSLETGGRARWWREIDQIHCRLWSVPPTTVRTATSGDTDHTRHTDTDPISYPLKDGRGSGTGRRAAGRAGPGENGNVAVFRNVRCNRFLTMYKQ